MQELRVAVECFAANRGMLHQGLLPKATTYGALINACRKRTCRSEPGSDSKQCFTKVSCPKRASTTPCSVHAGIERIPQRAWKRIEAMLHQGLLPKAIIYSALFSACMNRGLPQTVLQRIKAMLHQWLLPKAITYCALISAQEARAPQRASKRFEAMLHRGLLPKPTVHNA